MLATKDINRILANAWSIEHDVPVHALYLGEPFRLHGLLCFFDGETLFVCCREVSPLSTDVDVACRRILDAPIFPRPLRINCWGDQLPAIETLAGLGYACVYEQRPDPVNEELIVDLGHPASYQRVRRRQRELRQRRRTYDCRVVDRQGLSWRDIALLRGFTRDLASELDSVDLSFFLTVPAALASRSAEDTIRVELTVGGDTRGWAFARVLNGSFAVLHCLVWDRALPGACDAIYAAVISEIMERRIRRLSLGLTMHEGLYRFKQKWGGRPVGEGFAQAIWHDRQNESSNLDAYHWPAAMARHYLEAAQSAGALDT